MAIEFRISLHKGEVSALELGTMSFNIRADSTWQKLLLLLLHGFKQLCIAMVL